LAVPQLGHTDSRAKDSVNGGIRKTSQTVNLRGRGATPWNGPIMLGVLWSAKSTVGQRRYPLPR